MTTRAESIDQADSGGELSRPRSSIGVLDKVAAILDILAAKGPLSPAELSAELDEPRSSVHRLVAALRDHQMVEDSSESGKVVLGLKLLSLGQKVASRFDSREAALPVMEELKIQSDQTLFLCIRRNWEAVCIERIEGDSVRSLALQVGGSMPLHLGAAPVTLLAFEDTSVWDEYFEAAQLVSHTDRSVTDPASVRERLLNVREKGYAISDEDITLAIAAIGAPIFDHKGNIVASLSMSGLRVVILDETREYIGMVVDGARRISEKLGWRPDVSS